MIKCYSYFLSLGQFDGIEHEDETALEPDDTTLINELDETNNEIDDEEILDPFKGIRSCRRLVSVFIIQNCMILIRHKYSVIQASFSFNSILVFGKRKQFYCP